jgi:hypothetical protein
MDFVNPNPKLRWIELIPDLAIGEVKEHYNSGFVGIRFAIHDVTDKGPKDWTENPKWWR